ncbi:MAG: hypothetical protein RL684_3020 [Pseudomonadota bacterium]|jgi:surfeit locus 1 family protein
MPSLPLTRRRRLALPPLGVLLTLAGIALFVPLGRWQWHRAAEKRAIAADFAAGMASAATPLGTRSTASLQRYAALTVSGRYDATRQFLLDNVIVEGHVGYEVLTPLQLDDGRWLLVNRGWVALPGGSRSVLPRIGLPEGAARTLHGRIDDLPAPALAAGRTVPVAFPGTDADAADHAAGWPRRTSYPATADLAAALGARLEPRQLLLADAEPDGYRRDWKPASSGFGPERHVSYAFQWWGLAALALVLFVVVNLKTDEASPR